MEDERALNTYNTMGLSRIQVQIIKRQTFDVNVVVIKREGPRPLRRLRSAHMLQELICGHVLSDKLVTIFCWFSKTFQPRVVLLVLVGIVTQLRQNACV